MKAIRFAAALTVWVTPAYAADGFMTGRALLNVCEGGADQQAACEGYLQGVSDTLDYIGQNMPATKINQHCVPPATKPEVLRRIFVKLGHMGLHFDQPASSLAIVAFTAVWRCGQNAEYDSAYETLGKALR